MQVSLRRIAPSDISQSSSSARGIPDPSENNPLCTRCRTNQVLLLNYKANYFPEDADVSLIV